MIIIIENTDNKYLIRWGFQSKDDAPMMLSTMSIVLGEDLESYSIENQGFYVRMTGEQVSKIIEETKYQEQNEVTKTFLREFGYLIDAPSE